MRLHSLQVPADSIFILQAMGGWRTVSPRGGSPGRTCLPAFRGVVAGATPTPRGACNAQAFPPSPTGGLGPWVRRSRSLPDSPPSFLLSYNRKAVVRGTQATQGTPTECSPPSALLRGETEVCRRRRCGRRPSLNGDPRVQAAISLRDLRQPHCGFRVGQTRGGETRHRAPGAGPESRVRLRLQPAFPPEPFLPSYPPLPLSLQRAHAGLHTGMHKQVC